MEEYISLEEVFEAYYECRKNKRGTCNALLFESDYESELVKLHHDINTMTYEIGKSIAFIVTRPVKREVFAADFRDRIVHHLIVHRLEPLFESVFIEDNYNCRKGKGVMFGVKRLHQQIKECSENFTRECYIMKNDLQGFFMSIHKPTLWIMLEKFIWENYTGEDMNILLYLVKKIVLHNPELNCIRRSPIQMWNGLAANKSLFTTGKDYGLPIGNLTSQMFANIYLNEIDQYVKNTLNAKYYFRYMDDSILLIKTKEEAIEKLKRIKEFLEKKLELKLNNKTQIFKNKQGVNFCGYKINEYRLKIRDRGKRKLKEKVKKLTKEIKEGKINSKDAKKYLCGHLGYLKIANTYNIENKLFEKE